MNDLDQRVLRLLELLHATPGDSAAWLSFLEALRTEISLDAIVVFAAQPDGELPGVLAGSGLGLSRVPLGELFQSSVHHPSASELPAGAVIRVEDGALRETALFREVLAPAGVRPGPGLIVVTDRRDAHVIAATFVLPRTASWQPSAADRALLERLAPHLVIARRLHVRLHEREGDTEALLSAFDHLALGVVMLTGNGRVSYANRSAAALLGFAPGFSDPAQLGLEIPDERTRAWRRLVGLEEGCGRRAAVYAHPEDGRPLQMFATPVGWPEREPIAADRYARAVFIADSKRSSGDPIGVLHELYDLTPSETRLALLLLADCSVEEAAKLLGIRLATARGVLKTIFTKTGTNRQASLVRLLLSGPTSQLHGGDAAAPPRTRPPPRTRRKAGSRRRRAPR